MNHMCTAFLKGPCVCLFILTLVLLCSDHIDVSYLTMYAPRHNDTMWIVVTFDQ